MSDGFERFDDRLQRIERKRRTMAKGYELHMQSDGLIVARPRRARGSRISPRGVVLFFGGALVFKGVLIASLGPVAYEERVSALTAGTALEQAGAMIMQMDPIAREIASWITPYLT